jgi:hypothetical protein
VGVDPPDDSAEILRNAEVKLASFDQVGQLKILFSVQGFAAPRPGHDGQLVG